ncbi:MAG: DUF1553 domain-containing protein [Planctomycetaceae bacterium]
MRYVIFGIVVLLCLATSPDLQAQKDLQFERDVLPILKQHCIDCHGPDTAESKLRLDSQTAALRGGDSGEKTIVPGHSDQSYLVERVTHSDPAQRMPPDQDALPPQQIATLKAWIDNADRWKEAQQAASQHKVDHWSFQPLVRPNIPDKNLAAIDAFVKAKLAESGLQMSPAADRRRLIRRLFLVMHGLPPTPEQVETFVKDDRSDAWERLVDDVLSNPRYGERWAQHWLDLVRFGETNGYETNRERPNAWPYRDWVIDAFNSDKPYQQFIIAQIAGDAVGDPIGTSFLVAGPVDIVKSQDPNLTMMQRQDELADIVNTTSTAFLGLTVGCARCHNHKFDPITQTDYYAMQAVFAGVNHGDTALPLPDTVNAQIAAIDDDIARIKQRLERYVSHAELREAVTAKWNEERFPPVAARFVRFTVNATNGGQPCIDELEVFSGDRNVALAAAGATATSSGDFEHPLHKLEHINDGRFGNARSWISAQATGGWVQIEFAKQARIDRIVWARDREEEYRDRLATDYRIEASVDGTEWTTVADSSDRKSFSAGTSDSVTYDFAAFSDAEADAGRELLKQLDSQTQLRATLTKPTLVYAGSFVQPGATHRLYRGEPGAPREQVAPAGIAALKSPALAQDSPEQLRRLTIARWIADEQNPLTARVLVNRLWQFQFGTGIVDTPSDFGANGTQPSHPQLLDWLAAEFVDSGWSVKHMQRLILLSKTWQQDSQPNPQAMQVDASSRLLWRFPPRRLEAEAIRDCVLAVTGSLETTMGGPGFSAFEVSLENVRHYFPKKDYGPDDWRRMVYQTKVRQERDSVFGVFDCPDASSVTPRRSRSTTPLQALNLFNSRFVMQQAERFAQRLDAECDSPQAAIARAYELCFGRSPRDIEMTAATDFVTATNWSQFARAMLNANEFVFVP